MPFETCEHCNISILSISSLDRHFLGQTLRGEVFERNEVVVVEEVRHSWHRGQENTVADWSQVKQGEYEEREQGADVEFDLPGINWVVVRSRLLVGHPCMQVVQSYVTQKTQPVDQEGRNKVDPSPSPVHR